MFESARGSQRGEVGRKIFNEDGKVVTLQEVSQLQKLGMDWEMS